MKEKVGFVILHYNDFEVTSKCIDSIMELDESNRIKIVVVDNNSKNRSGVQLKEKYAKYKETVSVLLLEKNYGFSKANNIGYEYLLAHSEEFKFIIIANNDIIFCQKNLIPLLERQYQEEKFYLAGPDVWAVYQKKHQNPLSDHPRSKQEIESWIALNKKKLRFVEVETVMRWIWTKVNNTRIYEIYRKNVQKNTCTQYIRNYADKVENVVLTGACLIFSKKFIKENKKPFEPETFFYHEEDILTSKCLNNKWKIIYLPDLHVEHLEGVVTKQKGYYKRMKFRYKNFINSGQIYLDYLNKQIENK